MVGMMDRRKLVDFFLQLYEPKVDQITSLAIVILGRYVEGLDVQMALQLHILDTTLGHIDVLGEFDDFNAKVSQIQQSCNAIGRPELVHAWLRSQFDERSNEIKLVRGCRQLSELVRLARLKKSDSEAVLKALDKYCQTSDIMNDIFKVG